MPENSIIQIDLPLLEATLDDRIHKSVTQIINAMLDEEADQLLGAGLYEHSSQRKGVRAGHYERKLTTKTGRHQIRVPKLKGIPFTSQIIERYRTREASVEEALMHMYFAGVSTRQVDDISQLLWSDRMPPQTLSDKLKKVYDDIDAWRERELTDEYPYVFMDGIWHKRVWGDSVHTVSILIAIGVRADGYREVIGIQEGASEDKESWTRFIRSLLARGLKGVRLVTGDKSLGLIATLNALLPDAQYQRCMVHFERNVISEVSPSHRAWAGRALKAVFAMEDRQSALDKAQQVASELRKKKLTRAAKCLDEGIRETLTYFDFPHEHHVRIRTNNMIEGLNRQIRRRTNVVGTFPDSTSVVMMITARVRYVTRSWDERRYIDMSRLGESLEE